MRGGFHLATPYLFVFEAKNVRNGTSKKHWPQNTFTFILKVYNMSSKQTLNDYSPLKVGQKAARRVGFSLVLV